MADTLDITAGAGTTIATDDVGGVHYQEVKLIDGTKDSSTLIAVDVGVKANALRVAPANDITDGTYIGDIKFGEALATVTNLAQMGGQALSMGEGVVAAGCQRVTLATDDDGVAHLATIAGDTTSIDGKVTACNTGAVVLSSGTVTTVSTVSAVTSLDKSVYVDDADWTDDTSSHTLVGGVYQSTPHTVTDGDVSPFEVDVNGCIILGTSAKAIGKLAANTGVDIGDVDVTSIVPLTGATNLGKARDVACGANDVGVMALAVRDDALTTLTPVDGDYVPLRVSSTGALHVTGGGGGTEYTEDVASANPIVGSAVMMERDDVLGGLTPAEGDWASLRCDANGALWTHDDALDAVIDGAFLNVNLNMAGTDAAAGEGVIDAQTQRVTIATDDDGVAHLATIAGDTTNIETAIQLLDNAVYVDDADWTDNTSSHLLVGGIYQSTPHTVTDGDVSPFQLDANGKIMVSGVTACNTGAVVISSGTVTTVSTVTSLTQMGGVAITMGEGALDGGCQRVTLATDDDGVAHLATIASDTTNIETAVQIIDDWDSTHGSAASADGPQTMAAYDATKPTVVTDGQAVRVLADSYGRLLPGVEPTRFQAVFDSADATGEAEVVHASAASTVIVVQSYVISSDVEGWIKLQDEDSTALTGKFWLKAGGGVAITLPENAPIVLGTDKDLEVICEAAGNVSVSATGYTIPG